MVTIFTPKAQRASAAGCTRCLGNLIAANGFQIAMGIFNTKRMKTIPP
jgi:hypothetical protein